MDSMEEKPIEEIESKGTASYATALWVAVERDITSFGWEWGLKDEKGPSCTASLYLSSVGRTHSSGDIFLNSIYSGHLETVFSKLL